MLRIGMMLPITNFMSEIEVLPNNNRKEKI